MSELKLSTMLLTRPHIPAPGSGLNPLVEEVSWFAMELESASPARLSSESAVQSASTFLTRVLEFAGLIGQLAAITELQTSNVDGVAVLRARLAFGVFGSKGTSAAETAALARLVDQRINSGFLPYRAALIDPAVVLDVPDESLRHTALIKQRAHTVESGSDLDDVEVMVRWNPLSSPWTPLSHSVLTRSAPTRIRATVMPTELSVTDRMQLAAMVQKANALLKESGDRPDIRYKAERAVVTSDDLAASYESPICSVEVAVISAEPLEELFLRHVGSCFTSEFDVIRRAGHTVVAGQRLLLGGFEIEREPKGLAEALRAGLPMRGGLQRRSLTDTVTLTECPLGLPLPLGGPIPAIPTGALRELPPSPVMSNGIAVGFGVRGQRIHLPHEFLARHAFITGATGTGKSTILVATAVHCLHAGAQFLLVDWHGDSAERVIAVADDLGVQVCYIDVEDGGSAIVQLLPKLDWSMRNLAECERAAGRFIDAIVSSMPKDWTGPRFIQVSKAIAFLTMAHGAEFAEAVEWIEDKGVLEAKLKHPAMPSHHASVLRGLHLGGSSAVDVRDWVTSKLHPFFSAAVRRVIGRAGEGFAIPDLVRSGAPIVLNLAGLPESDAKLIGHLITSGVTDAAMSRPVGERTPIHEILDEAQKLTSSSMQRVQTEGRKFGVSLMLASQTQTQLDSVLADIAASAAVVVAFRQTPSSADQLSPLLDLPQRELLDVPDLHAYVKVTGHATCSLAVDPYPPCPPRRDKLPLLGIAQSVTLAEDAAPIQGSFMDEWLAKRTKIA